MKDCPLFPLHTVLFPGGVLPLQIFEARYLDMVAKCMREDSGFVIVLISEGQEAGKPATHHEMGTYCRIIDFDQKDNGLLGITVQGEYRVKITRSYITESGLIQGDITQLPHLTLDTQYETTGELATILQQIQVRLGKPYSELTIPKNDMVWQISRLLEWTGINPDKRYELLCIPDGQEMIARSLELLRKQT